jgi:hypothetical protein
VTGRRPRFPGALSRPRLLAAATGPCVVLLAPAGGGKTVLAAQLADAADRVVWVRPEAPGAPAATLVARACAQLGTSVSTRSADPAPLAEALLEAAGEEPFLLVLDEADRADAADVAKLVAELVPLLDEHSGVVVGARERPAGLLGRLGGAVRLLDGPALAFTVDEIAALRGSPGVESADEALRAATGGWPAAVVTAIAAGAEAGQAGTRSALAESLAAAVADDPACHRVLDLLALCGAASASVLDTVLGGRDTGAPSRLVARTPLVQTEADRFRLADPARAAWHPVLPPETVAALAAAIVDEDPATAVDLSLNAGRFADATGFLAGAVGRLPVDWVRPRLYRLPAELRRTLPPALSAVRATVDLGSARVRAERAVATARGPVEHAAARFALGSALAHSGELEAAAAELAAASRASADPATARAADGWLALVRFYSGDLAGALAAAGDADTVLAAWVAGECALASGDLDTARTAADRARRIAAGGGDLGEAIGLALLSRVDMHAAGTPRPGTKSAALAERAYQLAVSCGGLELLAAAPAHGAYLLAAGRPAEAGAVAGTLRRTVGRQDAASRLQAALLQLAVARLTGDQESARQAESVVRTVRAHGFALVEAEASRLLPGLAQRQPALSIRLLGRVRIEVADRVLPGDAWRSRKAREALLLLAATDPRGLRRDELVEAVWPGREPGRGRTLLRTALAEIRRVLEPGRPSGEPSAFLHADRERVRLVATVDIDMARQHAASGRDAEALALLGADLAEGEPDLSALDEVRAEVGEWRLRVARRIGRDQNRSAAERAAAYETVLALQPWRRELAEELVALWWRAGDPERARAADERYLTG